MPNRRLMQVVRIVLLVALGGAVGVVATLWKLKSSSTSRWFTLTADMSYEGIPNADSGNRRSPVSYAPAAFLSDIGVPRIVSLSGNAKFLTGVFEQGGKYPIGYQITLSTTSLDKSKLPDKYKEEQVLEGPGGSVTRLPMNEAAYEVCFELQLLDKDGFVLLTAETPNHTIRSGATGLIQSQTVPIVTRQVADHTEGITLRMVVTKCLSSN